MTRFDTLQTQLRAGSQTWLITGVAGFIGSNLLEFLLRLDRQVVGLDNFSTGHWKNLIAVREAVTDVQWSRFTMHEGDIREPADCSRACVGVNHVLHHAALGSVPISVAEPLTTHAVNLTGFLNVLIAARDARVNSFVYAASSSAYGDLPGLPKAEESAIDPLTPYAATKCANELYARAFGHSYGMQLVGLRYFNVYGPRQDPAGAYAAVLPAWATAIARGDPVYINGDGENSRDFCFVADVIQANVLAAMMDRTVSSDQVFNIALGERITLNQLLMQLTTEMQVLGMRRKISRVYRDYRLGDVRHSHADIKKAREFLDYAPQYRLGNGLRLTIPAYLQGGWCEK
jgi:UDP-N-acetylglucosamine/UDP-N-acetylgalactosamine 4-epimerase